MDRDTLTIKLRALMLDIIGVETYHIDVDEDLREKRSFDQIDEQSLIKSINREFNVNIDITSLKPLTLDNIVDSIMQEKAAKEVISPAKEKKKIQYFESSSLQVIEDFLFDRLMKETPNPGPVGRVMQ
jgi:hypothetical protein